MDMVDRELGTTLPQQPDLKKKSALLERLRAIQADVDTHATVLSHLMERAMEMHEKTGDHTFGPESRGELSARFADISAAVKVIYFQEYSHNLFLFNLLDCDFSHEQLFSGHIMIFKIRFNLE